jgi:hypothetical protein
MRDVVTRAIKLIEQHPAVAKVTSAAIDEASEYAAVDVTFRVNLPNAWSARGVSPNGIRTEEVVQLTFSPDFPLSAPSLSLRADFDRNLPHIQPWLDGNRPVPCIYDGPLSELLHHEGLAGILNQTAVWLDRAALGELIDPEQGWEPVRRDGLDDFIVSDADELRRHARRAAGYKFFDFEYLRFTSPNGKFFVHGEVKATTPKLNPKTLPSLFLERAWRSSGGIAHGRSVALLVWPGKQPSGELVITDRYMPETVSDVDGLYARAAFYGCDGPFKEALSWLQRCIGNYSEAGPFALAILICARRPCHVIGSDSVLELCPYITDIGAPKLFRDAASTLVRPAGHRHRINQALLQLMSGDEASEPHDWTLLGCGSLGSKIAIHLVRAGRPPRIVVDQGYMSPHNAARHALIPPAGDLLFSWSDAKATLMAEAIRGLGQAAIPLVENAVTLLGNQTKANVAWSRHTWAVINATASLSVREAIAVASLERLPARVLETSMFASGRVGLLTIEGPARNPNSGDLITAAYDTFREDRDLAKLVFAGASATVRRATGEGCGSLTMTLSDGRSSLFAASMAEAIADVQRTSLPTSGGAILIGRLSGDGISLNWSRQELAPVSIIRTGGHPHWRVRINHRAHEKILAEIGQWPKTETGGVVMGRMSEASRTFYVVDVLPAPSDSLHSPAEFVLGLKGMRQAIEAYSQTTNWALYCLGTWHNHLEPSGPSGIDHATAAAVAIARLAPSVLLIHTPTGYQALVADANLTPATF